MTQNELLAEIKQILQINDEEEKTSDLTISDRWDSMGQISILAMLKKKTGVMITANELANINTVQDILNLLEHKGFNFE